MGKGYGLTSRIPQKPLEYEHIFNNIGAIKKKILKHIYIVYYCPICFVEVKLMLSEDMMINSQVNVIVAEQKLHLCLVGRGLGNE